MKANACGSPTDATTLPAADTTVSQPRWRDSTRSPRLTSTRTGGASPAAARALLPVAAGSRPGRCALATGGGGFRLAEDRALAGRRARAHWLAGLALAALRGWLGRGRRAGCRAVVGH